MKKAGVLMPIASLPSNHGIGDFGKSPAEDNKDSMWDLPPILRSKSE